MMAATSYDAVVIGAGPYGLSTTAHLRGRGLSVAIFGKPLQLWREQMPQRMFLRSYWWATNLSDPGRLNGFKQYFQAHNVEHDLFAPEPVPIATFIDYGLWFQKQVVPDVDETFVAAVARNERQFEVTLADGRVLHCAAVVMAPGLAYYTYRPAEYDHLPAHLVSHSANHRTFCRFAGKRVVVIGGGQSALETAALLHESGADVDVVTRRPIVWLTGDSLQDRSSWLSRLRRPTAGIAPGWPNWLLERFPYAFQQLPRASKDRLLHGRLSHGPAGSRWLMDRVLGKLRVHERQSVRRLKEVDDGAALTLSNGTTLRADHIILGTGYRVDINRLPMLASSLVSEIRTYENAPVLNGRFESSVPGLYFVGFSSVRSCGPLFRFVVGADATAQRVAGAVEGRMGYARQTQRLI
jgi:FAD-dependent urate hydroxylase